MKKNYFFSFLAFCTTLLAEAQPTLTSSEITNYAATIYSVPEVAGTIITDAGPNQTWDYSALIPSTEFSPAYYISTIPVNSAPFYTSFPNTNYCQKASITVNEVLYESYGYANLSPAGIETFGSSDPLEITTEYTDTPFTPLPLVFGQMYSDTFQSTTDVSPSTTESTYDAYGTLITYFGTYSNVIRLKQLRETYTGYSFIKVNPYSPLMSITVDNTTGDVIGVNVYDTSGLATNQTVANPAVMLYPNPTKSVLNLQLPNNTAIDKITITDLTGKMAQEQSQNTEFINVENLANGIYILQATSGTNSFESKFIKQ